MSSDKLSEPKELSKNLFPVVGIGASAGGLEAFQQLLKAIPENSGMAYILVQHLHPDHESALPEILQRATRIPVVEISDNVHVDPDHIYVIPSNKVLIATDGILKLSPRIKSDKPNLPIDIFFSSLAEIHQNHAIGVVLSGTGNDGTAGLKDIKNSGGYTFAQDPTSAQYSNMPQHAIDADIIDFILAPDKIPVRLIELNQSFAKTAGSDDSTSEKKLNDVAFRQILSLLKVRVGVDFNLYKQTTVRRRIIRRMVMLQLETITEYLDHLKKNKPEQDILFNDLLIQVTSFFRDESTFKMLCEIVLPEILKNSQPGKSINNPLRIWVAACSTGQEAYSIAMCCHEYLSENNLSIKVQIFATDLSEGSIKIARAGIYSKRETESISAQRLQHFFKKVDGHYQIQKSVRDMCVFATHNFLKDPPFAKMDLISCRNVLIYLEPFLQRKALTIFHYALNDKGVLLLGKSETKASAAELFVPLGKKDKFFTRVSSRGRFIGISTERKETANADRNDYLRPTEGKGEDYHKSADDILLSRYAPVGVIVNEQFDIVQFRGSTGEYLEASPGKASLNVLKMAKGGLAFELRNALHKTKNSVEPFIKEGIIVNTSHSGDETGQEKKLVTLEVFPLNNTVDPHFLVLFKPYTPGNYHVEADNGNTQILPNKAKDEKSDYIEQLEKELEQARKNMHSITEDQEAVNEELQSANEELLSGSEELQSLNEELETSTEELQSSNEELMTVNQELYDTIEQLNKSRKFAEATIATLHEPLIILDQNFAIKSANAAFYKSFHIMEEETLGKNLFELQNYGWNIPGLRKELVRIQKEKEKAIEVEIPFSFPNTGERIICFNIQPIHTENSELMILLALDDITLQKKASLLLKEKAESAERFRILTDAMPEKVWTADAAGNVNYFNNKWFEYTKSSFEELKDWGWEKVIHPEDWEINKLVWQQAIISGEDFQVEHRFLCHDGTYRWHLSRGVSQRDEHGKILMWIGTNTDIDDQKLFSEELEKQIVERKELERHKNDFISMASHELKTPVTSIKGYTQILQHKFKKDGNDEAGTYLTRMDKQINKLTVLISDLLDATKVTAGQLKFSEEEFEFNTLIKEITEDIQQSANSHTVKLQLGASAEIYGDRNRIGQVMINLLSNAIKYSPGAHEVIVSTDTEDGKIKFSVKDFGIGISKENQAHVFDQFYRVSGPVQDTFAGLGLGLYIASQIIKRSNGVIGVESEEGNGTTFFFSLPVKNK